MPEFPLAFHFSVQFGTGATDDEDARFQEVTGINAEITTEELREGGFNDRVLRLPTGMRYANLVLKRGYIKNSNVSDWCRKGIEQFEFEPTKVDVSLLDWQHVALATWSFDGAYPVKWALSDLRAQENALAIETLELAFLSMKRV